MCLFLYSEAVTHIRAAANGEEDIAAAEMLRLEIRDMADTRCEGCSGFGHCFNGVGRNKAERAATKCPNSAVLKKRLGQSRAAGKARAMVLRLLKSRRHPVYSWGVNGGTMRGGRMIGRYNQHTHLRNMLSAARAYWVAHRPAGHDITDAEYTALQEHIIALPGP